MVFHWSPSDSKSLQISRTLLKILINLNISVVWRVSILPLISNSYCLFSTYFKTIPITPTIIFLTVTLTFRSFFSSLARSKYLSLITLSFISTLWFYGMTSNFYFSFVTRLSGLRDRLSDQFVSKIPENFMRLILLKGFFWFVHIPFSSMVKLSISCTFPSRSPFPTNRV